MVVGNAASGAVTVSTVISSTSQLSVLGQSIAVNAAIETMSKSLTLSALNGITISNRVNTKAGSLSLNADSDNDGWEHSPSLQQ